MDTATKMIIGPNASNSGKPQAPSKLPLPVPQSRFNTATDLTPSSTSSPPQFSPSTSSKSNHSTPTKVPRASSKKEISSTVSISSTARIRASGTKNTTNSLGRPRENVRTYHNGYVSADGYKYGPQLIVSEDADRLILGLKNKSRTKLEHPWSERKAKTTDLKPLPKLSRLNSLKATHQSFRRLRSTQAKGGNELQFASDVATKLLRQASISNEVDRKKEIITVASGLVEAITSAREAEIDMLNARGELSAAAVKVLAAKANRAKSQKTALDIGKRALRSTL